MASADAVDEHELIVIKGLCCCNTALYPQIPECIGCSSKSELLCLVTQCCLKCGTPAFGCKAFDDDACLQCGLCCCAIGLKSPTTICKSQAQNCCIVANARGAAPEVRLRQQTHPRATHSQGIPAGRGDPRGRRVLLPPVLPDVRLLPARRRRLSPGPRPSIRSKPRAGAGNSRCGCRPPRRRRRPRRPRRTRWHGRARWRDARARDPPRIRQNRAPG